MVFYYWLLFISALFDMIEQLFMALAAKLDKNTW